MSEPFDTRLSLVVVRGFVIGPSGRIECRLAVDTAAGVRTAGRIRVERLDALGLSRDSLLAICHTVEASTHIDGLLGLDFLRGRILTLDFARGRIALRPPRPWWAFWR